MTLENLLLLVNICDGAVISTTNSYESELITICREIFMLASLIGFILLISIWSLVVILIPSSRPHRVISSYQTMNCTEHPDILVSCMLTCCTWRISQLHTTKISWHFLSLSKRESPCESSTPKICSYWCLSSIAPIACISCKSLINIRRGLTKLILSYTLAQRLRSEMTRFLVTTRTSELTSASHALLVPIIRGCFSNARVPRGEGRPSVNHNTPMKSCDQERS